MTQACGRQDRASSAARPWRTAQLLRRDANRLLQVEAADRQAVPRGCRRAARATFDSLAEGAAKLSGIVIGSIAEPLYMM